MSDNVLGFPHRDNVVHYPCDVEPPCEGHGLEIFAAQNPAPDPVNHPAHYNVNGVETIDIIEHGVNNYPSCYAYHIGNCLKYIFRAPLKGSFAQDLEKAHWYLSRVVRMVRDATRESQTVR